ncbi:hypothetical protein ACQPZF_27770 [Actinosynnema sp. CS-041913]|uniref:hypothetical protein n=1 Tax=Actinosynnema sp. CS-041913 TaxID=3239917 RepID=UPI003D8F9B5F
MKRALGTAVFAAAALLSTAGTASASTTPAEGLADSEASPRGSYWCPPFPWYFCGSVVNASDKDVVAIKDWRKPHHVLRPGQSTPPTVDYDGVRLPCTATGIKVVGVKPQVWIGGKGDHRIHGYEKLVIMKVLDC